jgi:hypothetical protein
MNQSEMILHISHVIVGILLLYISIQRKVNILFYNVILLISLVAIIYHIIQFYNTTYWLYLFHLVVILPVICAVGLLKYDTPDYLYKILLFIAFGTIGYHGYNLLKDQLNIYHGSILAIILIILFV